MTMLLSAMRVKTAVAVAVVLSLVGVCFMAQSTQHPRNTLVETFDEDSPAILDFHRILPSKVGEAENREEGKQSLWENDFNVVHVVNSRFMQHQPFLAHLGRARLDLFETITRPSMMQQTTKQYLWMIWTDANLDSQILQDLLDAVSSLPNVVVLASDAYSTESTDSNFRSLYGLESWSAFQKAILFGSAQLAADYWRASQTHILMETRLDADDALSRSFIQSSQAQVATSVGRSGAAKKGHIQHFCPNSHIAWQYFSANVSDIVATSTDTAGQLIQFENKDFCLSTGWTIAYHLADDAVPQRKLGPNCHLDDDVPCCDKTCPDGWHLMMDWNLISLGDYFSVSDVEGTSFIGGTITNFNSHNYGIHLISNGVQPSEALVIAGFVTKGNPINLPSQFWARVGPSNELDNPNNANQWFTNTGPPDNRRQFNNVRQVNGIIRDTNLLAERDAITQDLQGLGDFFSSCPPFVGSGTCGFNTESISGDNYVLTVNEVDENGMVVFEIDAADAFEVPNRQFQIVLGSNPNCDSDPVLIIVNVKKASGNTVVFAGGLNFIGLLTNSAFQSKVIFNWDQSITSVDFAAPAMRGMTLAPYTDVFIGVTGGAPAEGAVWAKSVTSTTEIHFPNLAVSCPLPQECRRRLRLLPEEDQNRRFAALDASVLLARTPTAAGMKNVLPHTKGGGVKSRPLTTFQSAEAQEQAWVSVEKYFGVAKQNLKDLHSRFESNMESILVDAFSGQCTPGHSCKESTKKALGYLLDKVYHTN